jgi:hypothetical protein
MDRIDGARIAAGVLLGVAAAVAITKDDLSGGESMLRWLVFVAVTGILINTADGKRIAFLLAAATAAAASLLATVLWFAALHDWVLPNFSGVRLTLNSDSLFAPIVVAIFFFASVFAVMIGAFARPLTLQLMQSALAIDVQKAKRAEQVIRALVATAGVALLAFFSLAK